MPKIAKPHRHGNRWRISHTDSTGRRSYLSATTRDAVMAKKRRLETQKVDGVDASTAYTWGQLATLWSELKASKASLDADEQRIRMYLTPRLGTRALRDITVDDINAIASDLRKRGLAISTQRKVLGLAKAMFRVALRERWIAYAPHIELPQQPEQPFNYIRSRDDIDKLLAKAAKRKTPPHMAAIFATAVFTGMRAGEVFGLDWRCVNFSQRLITVERSFSTPTKTRRIRYVPILDVLLPIIDKHHEGMKRPSRGLVFPNERGRMHATRNRVQSRLFKDIAREAGLHDLSFHDLRHTFASHWVMNGGDLYKLQRILGHTTPALTQRYAHLAPDAFRGDWGLL